MKKIAAFILLFALVFTLGGCGEKDKVFTCEELSITLNDSYTEKEIEGYNACFDSPDVAVFVLKEKFSIMDGFEDYTLDQYASFFLKANSSKNPVRADTDGLTAVSYSSVNSWDNQEYTYLAFLYKGEDAFWMVQFYCEAEKYESQRDYFIERAKTVTFN